MVMSYMRVKLSCLVPLVCVPMLCIPLVVRAQQSPDNSTPEKKLNFL